ncbi:MAG TPA: PIN domain-containing protein [Actinomycetota bacterium]|nr:PIN domain-containing protein [Actinomycetota bacterium]
MIVLDTSGLLSAIDSTQRHHRAAADALQRDPGPFVLSPLILAELDYLLGTRVGVGAEISFLQEVAAGAYRLEPYGADDVTETARLVARYRDLGLGAADASIVVLAARHRTTRLLTLDERHFRAIRPLHGRAFRLLPLDR